MFNDLKWKRKTYNEREKEKLRRSFIWKYWSFIIIRGWILEIRIEIKIRRIAWSYIKINIIKNIIRKERKK